MSDTSPPNQQAFYGQVWSLVRQVPSGKVVTYGQIARCFLRPRKWISKPTRRSVHVG